MKTFEWCEQSAAEFCSAKDAHVHVCITTPGYRQITPRCGHSTINQTFFDLDPAEVEKTRAFSRNPAQGAGIRDGCFSSEQAEQIAILVEAVPDGTRIVVNCEGGVSRSPAVVLALKKFYGMEIGDLPPRTYPNPHVEEVMIQVLQARGM